MKLIICDMDGTLLDDQKNVPSNFQEVLDKLKEQDIKMALASGRSIYSIKEKVADYDFDFIFIGENGAIIEYNDDIIYESVIPQGDVERIVQTSSMGRETTVIACGKDKAYVKMFKGHDDAIEERFPGFEVVKDPSKVDDRIYRVSMYSPQTEFNFRHIYKQILGIRYNTVLTGNEWINITNTDTDKGSALAHLATKLSINLDDVVAFGDFDNDVVMFEKAGTSFAMANASDDAKKAATEVIGSNNDNGVTTKINELL